MELVGIDDFVPSDAGIVCFSSVSSSSLVFKVWAKIEHKLINDLCDSPDTGSDILGGPALVCRHYTFSQW